MRYNISIIVESIVANRSIAKAAFIIMPVRHWYIDRTIDRSDDEPEKIVDSNIYKKKELISKRLIKSY